MYTHDSRSHKVADLTVEEFKSLLIEAQSEALVNALKQVTPQRDPDEDVYLSAKEAGALIGVSRQTIQEKKRRKLLKFFGEGRIQRTTKAECKRYLKEFGSPLSRIKSDQKKAEVKRNKK